MMNVCPTRLIRYIIYANAKTYHDEVSGQQVAALKHFLQKGIADTMQQNRCAPRYFACPRPNSKQIDMTLENAA